MKFIRARIELRTGIPVDGEARPGDLRRPFEIEDAELRAEVPVSLRLEIELTMFAGATDFHVVRFAAGGNGLMRQVGDAPQDLGKRVVERIDVVFETLDLLADFAALLHRFVGILTGAFGLGNLGAQRIAARFEVFDLGDGGAAFLVHLVETAERLRRAPRLETLLHMVEILPKKVKVQHGNCLFSGRKGPKTLGPQLQEPV